MRTMLCLMLWALALPAFSADPLYLATAIPSAAGQALVASGLNNNGDIVGSTGASAFVYLHRSRTVYLLPHPTANSGDSGAALNDYGKVAGTSEGFNQPPQSAVWYLTGGSEVLAGGRASYATGVSNDGQVTANNFTVHGTTLPVIWAWKPTLHEIPVPQFSDFNCCYPTATVNGINNFSHVVGDSTLSQYTDSSHSFYIEGDHAYLYANGALTDLGVLGNPHPADSLGVSVAYGLNNHDDVVGQSEVGTLSTSASCPGCVVQHAFLWRRGKLTDLGNLGHVAQWTSIANSVNDADEIVGSADANVSGVPTTRAFVYVNRSMYNLTFMVNHRDLNVRLVDAVGINCNGWIVANGFDVRQPTVNRVYLLIPQFKPLRLGCPRPR